MQQLADRPRATRYEIVAEVQYRRIGQADWQEGQTVNVSRTGVLFETCQPAIPAATRIEFVLLLPSLGLPCKSRVRCWGEVVRHGAPTDSGCAVAATIDAYEFLEVVPETSGKCVDIGRV